MMNILVTTPFTLTELAELQVPAGWTQTSPEADDYAIRTVLRHPDDQTVELCFYDRVVPISNRDGNSFINILSTAHELTDDEWYQLEAVIGDYVDPSLFERSFASVDTLNGKMVLMIQGKWLADSRQSFEVFIPRSENGKFIQQIWFNASPEMYDQLFADIVQCLQSIKWL